jgi:hypothetical protein
LKEILKKINLIAEADAVFKSKLQEHKAARELVYYQRKALRSGIKLLEYDALSQAIKGRLAQRGIHPVLKCNGDLHIFLIYALNNWEAILPIALKPFGRVSEFELCFHGFDSTAASWFDQRDAMNEAMLEAFCELNSAEPIDIVVGYLSGYVCDPALLREMAQSGAVILNFCWDDKLGFRGKMRGDRWTGPAALTSAVDLNLTNAPESRIKYLMEGGLAMFWPEAAHPCFHKPYDFTFEYDVSFVGGKYGWRLKFIEKLRKAGINVVCFGNGWENGPLSDEEMIKLYSRSRINLGFAGVGHSRRLMCLKGRDFEVPMSGGLYLTQSNPELSLVYDVGKEIVTYENDKDCTDKIRWLLVHPDETDAIRKAGRIRALKDHSWEKRFEDVFRIVGVME